MFLWLFWYADGRLADMWKGAASSFWAVGMFPPSVGEFNACKIDAYKTSIHPTSKREGGTVQTAMTICLRRISNKEESIAHEITNVLFK